LTPPAEVADHVEETINFHMIIWVGLAAVRARFRVWSNLSRKRRVQQVIQTLVRAVLRASGRRQFPAAP
jgi:hypothetical protein